MTIVSSSNWGRLSRESEKRLAVISEEPADIRADSSIVQRRVHIAAAFSEGIDEAAAAQAAAREAVNGTCAAIIRHCIYGVLVGIKTLTRQTG